jgi:hypothetical protein
VASGVDSTEAAPQYYNPGFRNAGICGHGCTFVVDNGCLAQVRAPSVEVILTKTPVQPLSCYHTGHRASGVGVQDQETVLDWVYDFRFRNGAFFIEPDMQYIIRPSGIGNIPNALVVSAQVGINF